MAGIWQTYDSEGDSGSHPSKEGGSSLFDRIRNWNSKRKQNADSQKSAGANDLEMGSANPASAKKGGMVKKTGKATIHKGERVLTRGQAKKYNTKHGPRKSV